MRQAPAFWWRTEASAPERLLAPLGAIIGAVAARRMARAGARVGIPIVCVGNFVAGGAGKTPTAAALAHMLMAQGERVFLLARGYGGARRAVPMIVESHHGASDVGDEPMLLARVAPTIVAPDRVGGAALAIAHGATVIVMDDGLQSRRLEPDLAVAVVDGETGVGNGRCLPAGPLRAPLAAQLRQVDVIILIGPGAAGEAVAEAAEAASVPVVRATLAPEAAAVARLQSRRVLAFAGIGRPEKFFTTLRRAGITVVSTTAFPDHHRFTRIELAALERRAAAHGLSLVTTEKDATRLPSGMQAEVLPVTLAVGDVARLEALLLSAVGRARARGMGPA